MTGLAGVQTGMLDARPRLCECIAWVGRTRDGTIDDHMGCATLPRHGHSRNAHLVVADGAMQLDSRRHDVHACGKASGEARSFLGGRHDTMAATAHSELGKNVNLLLDGWGKPHFRQVAVGEACDDSHRKNLQAWIGSGRGDRRPENGAAARGVHCHHARAELACGANGSDDGVRDLMQLQVKKDLFAHGNQFSNNGRALHRKKLQADLVGARRSAKLPNQFHGFASGIEVEGNDDR